VKVELSGTLRKQAEGRVGRYTYRLGVDNKQHKGAKPRSAGLKSFAGGPARKTGQPEGISIAQIAQDLIIVAGVNYWTEPFKKKSQDIVKFTDAFFKLMFDKTSVRRGENLLQAVVRNPILLGVYGKNSKVTAQIKGFNRLMIDTGQFFSAIEARIYRSGKRVV
jgi:hypothetical protein